MRKPVKSTNPISNRVKSFVFAFRGIFVACKSGVNIWIQLFIGLLVIIAGFVFEISKTEWLFAIFAMGMVLTAEIFNTAIEKLVDLVSPDYHSEAGKTKDLAAGAVLLAAICAAIIGLIIFIPKIVDQL